MIQIGDLTLLTIEETAEKLHLTKRAVWLMTRKGELKVYKKVGRLLYINEKDIISWLEAGQNEEGKKDEEEASDK